MVSTPLRFPVEVGKKRTWTVQLALTAIVAPAQLSVSLKSPVVVTELTMSEAIPVFVTVRVCDALEVATACTPKLNEVGLRLMEGCAAVAAVRSGICQIPRP